MSDELYLHTRMLYGNYTMVPGIHMSIDSML